MHHRFPLVFALVEDTARCAPTVGAKAGRGSEVAGMIVGVAAGLPSAVAGMAAGAATGAAIAGTYAVVADAPTVAGTSVDDLAVAHVVVVGTEMVAALSAVAGTATVAGGAVQAHCRR